MFLDNFGVQFHHLPPNAIIYLSAFISLCKNFLDCHPHWGLFKNIFTCRSMILKDSLANAQIHVTQLCGGLGIKVRGECLPEDEFPRFHQGVAGDMVLLQGWPKWP